MTTMASTASPLPSKLFGNQRLRTYRSSYGSYSSYESSSPRLEKSFISKRATTPSNGPNYSRSTDRSYTSSSRTYSGSGYGSNLRRGTSLDRDIDRCVNDSGALFTHAKTSLSRDRNNDDVTAESSTSSLRHHRRRRYSISLDRESLSDAGSYEPPFTAPRRKYTDIIEQQKQRRQLEIEQRENEKRELKERRDEAIRGIIKRGMDDDYSGFDYRTLLDGIPKRQRSSSISCSEEEVRKINSSSCSRRSRYEYRPASRASSVARGYLEDAADDYTSLRPRRRRSASVTPLDNVTKSHYDDVTKSHYDSIRTQRSLQRQDFEMSTANALKDNATYKRDISSYVLDPHKPFTPDDIKVKVLPSGKRATTYTQSQQYGSNSESTEANAELDKVIQKTKLMQDSMHTLENFVRANRNLFPEDTCVYQQIRFFQLTKEQLLEIGEAPDAILYGVKMRERLVVPHGTDVTDILSRYYGNKENIEIQYSDKDRIKAEVESEADRKRTEQARSIRTQVEAEFDQRDTQRILGNESMAARHATWSRDQYDSYKHLHPHLTDNYVKSFYVNAGLTFEYTPPKHTLDFDTNASLSREDFYTKRSMNFNNRKYDYRKINDIQFEKYDRKTRRFGRFESDGKKNRFEWDREASTGKSKGLDYDSIYDLSRSQPANAPVGSDVESVHTRSTAAPSMSAAERKAKQRREDFGPQFTSAVRPKRTTEGCTVRFNCSVTAVPMPDVVWMRGNTPLSEGGRIHISNNFGLLSLEISDVKKEDAGVYTVKISNKEGEAVCSAALEVQEPAKAEEKLDGARRPWFILEAQNQWCEVGQRVTFEAQATGRPTPQFKWTRDNLALTDDDRIRTFSDEQGNAKLVIRNLTHTDNGLYFCVAESKAGRAKCAATLKVVGKGQLGDRRRSASRSRDVTPMRSRRSMSRDSTPLHINRFGSRETTPTGLKEQAKVSGTAPWFLQTLPAQLEVHEGEPIDLKCIVDGEPKPKVTWLKEPYRELMYSKRHRVVCAGDHHFMIIKSSISTDTGRFMVMAENEVGRIQSSCWVNMLPPRVIDAGDDYDVRCSLVEMPDYEYEIETSKEQGKMAPRFIKKLPHSKEVKAGDDITVECKIDQADAGEVLTDVHIKTKVVKEGAIKTVTVEKTGAVKVERDVFVGRDKTPTGEEEVKKPLQQTSIDAAVTTTVAGIAPDAAEPAEQKEPEVANKQPEAAIKPEEAQKEEVESLPVEEENIKPLLSDRPQKAPQPIKQDAEIIEDQVDFDLEHKVIEVDSQKTVEKERSPTPINEETIEPLEKEAEKSAMQTKVTSMTNVSGETMTVAGITPDSGEKAETEQGAVMEAGITAEKTIAAEATSTELNANGTFTSKQKLQLLGSSSEDRCESPPSGSSVKIKTKTKGETSITNHKTDESHMITASVTLEQGSERKKGMRRMSSKELFLVRPASIQAEPLTMTVAGIPPTDTEPAAEITTEVSEMVSTKETQNGMQSEIVAEITAEESETVFTSQTVTGMQSEKVAEITIEGSTDLSISQTLTGIAPKEKDVAKIALDESDNVSSTQTVAGIAPKEKDVAKIALDESDNVSSTQTVAGIAPKEKDVAKIALDESDNVSSTQTVAGIAPRESEMVAEVTLTKQVSALKSTASEVSESCEAEITVVVQSGTSETQESLSPSCIVRKGESRAESVISEDPTESSWTEYTSEATLTESEADTEIDDVIIVKKVSKVTRQVIEVIDGEEKTVSKVTEVTTSVTGGEQEAESSSEEESSIGESSSEESSSEESSAESTDSTVEIGKGSAISADVLKEEDDKADDCSTLLSSSAEETEVEVDLATDLQIVEDGETVDEEKQSGSSTSESSESEDSGTSEDSDSDSETSSEEE